MKHARLAHFSLSRFHSQSHLFRQPLALITALIASCACAVGTMACAGCGSTSAPTSSTAKPSNPLKRSEANAHRKISIMLDWTANTNHVGVYTAARKGYYRLAGLDVTILPTAQAGAETAVQTGVADAGFTTVSNVAAVDAKGSNLHFVFDVMQKPNARWCALASRKDITSPKNFSGKTFVTFGSAEQTAVIKQMISHAGGKPTFSTVTVGTSTFQSLANKRGDFAGFYDTWEGVQSRLNGPSLRCYQAQHWGVPGNPDQFGIAVNRTWEKTHETALRRFIKATEKGYRYALLHPQEAASILVADAPNAAIEPALAQASMKEIVSGHFWGPIENIGRTNIPEGQKYVTFLWSKGVYGSHGSKGPKPIVSHLATNKYFFEQRR